MTTLAIIYGSTISIHQTSNVHRHNPLEKKARGRWYYLESISEQDQIFGGGGGDENARLTPKV